MIINIDIEVYLNVFWRLWMRSVHELNDDQRERVILTPNLCRPWEAASEPT